MGSALSKPRSLWHARTKINKLEKTRDSSKDIEDPLVSKFQQALPQCLLVTPESPEYAESIRRWSDAVEKRAGVVVYPQTAQDISTIISLTQTHGIDFVVAGGKHSSGGASSIEGGLVIDLAKMRQIQIRSEDGEHLVTVGGGAVWKDVDEALGEQNLATVGGTVNHTGVGGLTLGGGYGWLSGKYGLAIDNLVEVTMVLGDGSIKKTSNRPDEYPDLFWAVRGAGASFGVAADFTFRAHVQTTPVWAGQLIFPAEEKADSIIQFANSFIETTDGNSAMIVGITAPPMLKGSLGMGVTVFHNGSATVAKKIFQPLLDLQPIINTVQERPYSEVNGMMNHAVEYGGRKLSKGATFLTPIQPTFVRRLMSELKSFHSQLPETKKTIILLEFFHSAEWCRLDRTATAFANRGDHQNAMIGPFWSDGNQDATCRQWARSTAALFRTELLRQAAQHGDGNSSVENISEYGNYDCLAATPSDIFTVNLGRLKSLKQKYDPMNVFNKSYNLMDGA